MQDKHWAEKRHQESRGGRKVGDSHPAPERREGRGRSQVGVYSLPSTSLSPLSSPHSNAAPHLPFILLPSAPRNLMTDSSSTYPMTSHFTRTGMGSGLEGASISLRLVSGDPHPMTLSSKSRNPCTTLSSPCISLSSSSFPDGSLGFGEETVG